MKRRLTILCVIATLMSLTARGQVFEMFYQGFEPGSPTNWNATGTYSIDNSLAASGAQCIKLTQSRDNDVEMILDTIDFTQNTQLRFITLEFDHINNIATNSGSDVMVGVIYVKLARDPDTRWQQLTSQNYNTDREVYSTVFNSIGTFNKEVYSDWVNLRTPTNDNWKSERFDLNSILTASVPQSDRKLIFKFVTKKKTSSGNATGTSWWIDNIRVRASQNQMVSPRIKMLCYPDGMEHPSSRGARVSLRATTSVAQGIAADSVYIFYRKSSDSVWTKQRMTQVAGAAGEFTYRVPFMGYDTLMDFYCQAKDATTNHNEVVFPNAAGSFVTYRCVRGQAWSSTSTTLLGENNNRRNEYFPFSSNADMRCEMVYDSALLANAGYKAGAITSLTYTVATNVSSTQRRPNFQIWMKNIPNNYETDVTTKKFTSSYMQVVYDTTYVSSAVGAGTQQTINFTDTFFYAGKDLLLHIIYDGDNDGAATPIRTIPAPATKKTIYVYDGAAAYGYNAYTGIPMGDDVSDDRAAFSFGAQKNMPLVYDMGISGFNYPNANTAMTNQPNERLVVWLKNYGANPVNAIRISYLVDETISGHYDWTGTLNGGDSAAVEVCNTLQLQAGYHSMRAWVEDTLTSASVQWRDHEPFNDTSATDFVVCAGAMHGTRTIGTPTSDYETIEQFLNALSLCGISDSLIVTLAPGTYNGFTLPSIPGLSARNYLLLQGAPNTTVNITNLEGNVPALVDLTQVSHIRFRNLNFYRARNTMTNMVQMSGSSNDCQFLDCTFTDSIDSPNALMTINAMINGGSANNVKIAGCMFHGGNIGVSLVGFDVSQKSTNQLIKNSIFDNQISNALYISNQADLTISNCEMTDVSSNSSYVALLYQCDGTVRFIGNKLYTSHGAGALGVSSVEGTSANHALIANNMVVCNDDGLSTQITTPFNIIQGNWIDVVYNSVKLTARERTSTAAATFGGGTMSNCRFLNNIVVCMDDVNYAFNYLAPADNNNLVNHNLYFSNGYTLNRRTGVTFDDLDAWQSAVTEDDASQSANPGFLNSTLVDLRTYIRIIKGLATPVPQVTTDMFGTSRDATRPCAGAFEFATLQYDFEPIALLQPLEDNCAIENNTELIIRVANTGSNRYTYGGGTTLRIGCKINNNAEQYATVTQAINSDDTVSINTGIRLTMPPNGLKDSTYAMRLWVASTNDPNKTNDTMDLSVISRYHATAPTRIESSVEYFERDTIVPTAGINMWSVYNDPSAPKKRSTLYWYRNMTDTIPMHIGDTLITDPLRVTQDFYVEQRRQVPVVRLTQVQLFRGVGTSYIGLTEPYPEWLASSVRVVAQLTNVGDAPANLTHDTLQTISTSSLLNNKICGFTGITLQPGQSMTVQYLIPSASTPVNPEKTMYAGATLVMTYDNNIGFVYRREGTIQDAVAFKDLVTAGSSLPLKWADLNIPNYVWGSQGVPVTSPYVCGYIRVAFNGDSTDWVAATNERRMTLGTIDSSLMMFAGNGCPGDKGIAHVVVTRAPSTDLELDNLRLPSGCGLGLEDVTVTVHNYGTVTANRYTLNYNGGGSTVSELVTTPIAAGDSLIYTFNTKLNMNVSYDSTFFVKVWSSNVADDRRPENDTTSATTFVNFTPPAPVISTTRTINYGTSDTITISAPSNAMPLWYGFNGIVSDTGYTFITGNRYTEGTIGVSYMAMTKSEKQLGNTQTVTTKTEYPSAFQTYNKLSKQQYIYTAAELTAMGLQPGPISAVAFYQDSLCDVNVVTRIDSITVADYYIHMGLTTDSIFASRTAWKSVTQVMHKQNMRFYKRNNHKWVRHEFDTPIIWDGTSNIVVQVAMQNTTAITSGIQSAYNAKDNSVLYIATNNSVSPSLLGYISNGLPATNKRPDIRITGTDYACEGPRTDIRITPIGTPQIDACISWPDGYDTATYASCGNVSLPITISNLGLGDLSNVKLVYYVDNANRKDTLNYSNVLHGGDSTTIQLFSLPLDPGRHYVHAYIIADNDNVHNNDTLSRLFKVRFCGGVYTVGGQSPDFDRFSKLIDTLNVVGIAGPVRIDIRPGIYSEQIHLGNIEGSSTSNTLTFHGENDSVFLRAATTQANNYVVRLNGASNVIIDGLHLESRPPSVQFGDVLVIQNASNIILRNSNLKVKGTLDNFSSSCLVLNGNVSKLNVVSNVFDSGYYSIHHAGSVQNYQNITISNNTLQNFSFHGINLRGVFGLDISGNYITSGMARSNRNLTGVYVANTTGKFLISKNSIYLIDAMNGGKCGLRLFNIVGINQQWGRVSNNMISCQHNCNPAQNLSEQPNGIRIDSSSAYVNICFNTVRINATGANQYNTMASSLYSGATNSHLIIMNNILANYGSGFAYDVRNGDGITTSNYNAYHTEGNVLALWNSQFISNLDTLRTRNNMDVRSLEETPYFVNDTNLHLVMTNFVTKAQYNPDVIDDIDGNTRPQIPAPTIGAHEMQRNAHDMTIVKIESPKMPENRNNPLNIESDSILVKVLFYNNGNSLESNVRWYAYMTNYRDTAIRISQSAIKILNNVPAGELFMDSILVPSPLGIIDTHMIHVVVTIGEDDNLDDNYMKTPVYLAPAYNLEATRMIVPSGCNLEQAVIQITLKNVGFKQFLPGDSIRIGYHTQGYYPSCVTSNLNANKINIRTMIDTVEETIILTEPIIENETKVFEFARKANLYPTDTLLNIKVRVDGWCKHIYDILTDNNATTLSQTSSPVVDAFYTPNAPHGFDTTFAYGTWGRVRSTQNNLPSTPLAVRWYRDTLSTPFYTNANYNTSRWWNNTPQFFHDSVYYLNCISAKNCTSKFSPVRVTVASPKPNDLSVEAIIAPLGNRVYMQNDTVRLRIINYGTQAQSNFPLAYQLRRNNAVLQTVTETYTGSIQPGQTVIYTFDSLLTTNSPTTAQAYTLKVWTDLANDEVRRNDTLRMPYTGGNTDPGQYYQFTSVSPSAALCVPGSSFEPGMLDISRVSYNCIDFDISSIGRTYTDLADFTNPEVRVLHVTRGMTDSLIVELNNINDIYSPIAGDISVFIDLDRSGYFDATERVVSPTTVIATEQRLATRLTIPNNASYGYMRMRVLVQPEGTASDTGCPTSGTGHAIDFLIFVDKEAVATDLAFTRIVSPRSFSIPEDDSTSVSFYVYNKGTQPVNEFEYMCLFESENPDSSQFVRRTWTGNLASNSGTVITLPYYHFPYGVTKVQIFHDYPNDADTSNNHVNYEYVRFHSVTLRMNEMFDSLNYWYAPSGRNAYTKNYWQLGSPRKSIIYTAYSTPNAWVTDLTNPIVSGKRGNASYLYSPIIDISQVRPDTIIFRLLRNLVNNSTLHLEYLNYQGHWTKLQHDSMVTFYNNEDDMVFDGTSAGFTYNRYWMRTTTNNISSEFPEKLQFRFVYRTPEGSSTGSSFGDGCAIDNFYIGRAQRAIDVGVIAITQPESPRFGELLYPQIVVKNYGYDTVRSMQIGYTHFGANLAKINEISCHIDPGATDTFTFTIPFLVTSNFPSEFEIEAFTQQPLDIYWDNDTLRKTFTIAPLDHDIAAVHFIQPLERVIAGDTQVAVSILIRNFGLSEIPTATATLDFNGRDRAVEIIDFNQMLGRPLESMEYFNYTFRKKFRASMGMMDLTAFIKSDSNDYIYNDTITHRINGISSIMDIAAAGVIADSSKHGTVQFELIIENRGARGANNFEVGFWIDNDTTTMVRETYYRDLPIPALSSAAHLFNVVLPMRSTGYRTLSGYVNINNDNDRSNDTTNTVVEQYFDLAVDKVIVEENANPDCRVFIKVTNVGNLALDSTRTLQLRGTVNGTNLSYNIRRQIDPGQSATLQFPTKIEKSPLRRYIGTGRFILAIDVMNTENNQTSVVEVVNYVEGVPTLSTSELDLGQNYPNPFSNHTVIPFSIPNSANVSLFIMDMMGKKVYESNQFYPAGDHNITINMDNFPTGIYYYGIEVDGDKKMKKMILR